MGERGEAAAAKFLRRSGYRIVARRYRMFPEEIDIVAVDRRTVVFVEVKTRASTDAGSPEEAVSEEKQRRLTRAAVTFLRRHDLLKVPSRFDVVAVTWPADSNRPVIRHIQNSFPAAFSDSWYG